MAAISEKLSVTYQKPCISLTYDGFLETNNRSRIGEFAELIKFFSRDKLIGKDSTFWFLSTDLLH